MNLSPSFAGSRSHGRSLLEVMIAVVLMSVLSISVMGTLRNQTEAAALASGLHDTTLPALRALNAIRDELKGVVQNPTGLAAGSYSMASTLSPVTCSFTWRPVVRYIAPGSANYDTWKTAGRVSSANVLYESYRRTIGWDSTTQLLTITNTPDTSMTLPAGVPPSYVLARNVQDFAFYEGEQGRPLPTFQEATPASWGGAVLDRASNTTYNVGTWIVVGTRNMAVGSNNSTFRRIYSNVGSGSAPVVLTLEVRLLPETLINSKTKPVVAP